MSLSSCAKGEASSCRGSSGGLSGQPAAQGEPCPRSWSRCGAQRQPCCRRGLRSSAETKGGGGGTKGESTAGCGGFRLGTKAKPTGGVGIAWCLGGSAEGKAPSSGSCRCGARQSEARGGCCGGGLLSSEGEAPRGLTEVKPATHFCLSQVQRCREKFSGTKWSLPK